MKKLICEICGGDALLKDGEHFRCTECGARYSAEHLKKMLEIPETPEKPVAPQPEAEVPAEPEPPKKKAKRLTPDARNTLKKGLLIALVCSLPIAFIVSVFVEVLQAGGMLPQKKSTKQNVEAHLEYRIEDENTTLESVHFDSVDVVKFRTREEDAVGYFPYIEKTYNRQNDDGSVTQHSSLDDLRGKLGQHYDPEADLKVAYILTGTYTANHKEHGEIPGQFRIVCVHNTSANHWYYVTEEYGASLDVLRQNVRNNLTAYLLLTYDIQPNPYIEITSIDNSSSYYSVYGNVTVRDKYGKEFTGRFTADYSYSSSDQQFKKMSMQVEGLS